MGFLKVRCEHCGAAWEVYAHQIHQEQANQCPHCFSEIDRQTWDRQIVPAFGALDDANREIVKDYLGYGAQMFRVDYTATDFLEKRR